MWIFFVAPAVLILLSLVIFPLIFSLTLSFHKWNIIRAQDWKWTGLSNYEMILFKDPYFRTSAKVTLIYLLGTVPVQFVLGLVVALLLNQITGKIIGFLRTTLIIPTIMTPVIVGIIWRLMYNPDMGMLNYFLTLFGFSPVNWTGMPGSALPSVMMADIWEWTPFMALIMLAGLQALPQEPFEAALVDGASAWQTFRYVTLPFLAPTMMVALLIRLMDAFKTFDLVFVLTQGGPGMSTEILNYYIYRYGFKFFHLGYASALSWLLVIVVTIFSLILIKRMRAHARGTYAGGV
ncbi:ABC transporter permease subunit [candidate division KSB3 bacterium]|uniref:ABC transporter permease subunit n=1 Tax=candidate division KSB3 bacterium TaxID=2044937 RepID=A0A9D5Q8P6_9BACT|nr:ABC transporter permease subunit [candidate division KSB3 bacterium]MBD3327582.1 ABC transporter permease subunit [candidate division KSB3 bacterium]